MITLTSRALHRSISFLFC